MAMFFGSTRSLTLATKLATADAIDLFFEDLEYREPPGQFGVLYLLRRDISVCLGRDPDTGEETRQTLWPGAMGVLAGIDLLGKHFEGTTEGNRTTFKNFLGRFFGLAEDEQKIIYQLRCALMHSFALRVESRAGQLYRFTVSAEPSQPLIQILPADRYVIDLLTLGDEFEKAVHRYHEALVADPSLQRKFAHVFEKQGSITVNPF